MIISNFRSFIRDESGAYTVWSLVWFSLYVAMGGLAVDMTDAYRTKMLLQSTADASALAAVISLPDQDDGRAQAVNFSKDNMFQNIHGTVVRSSEVVFGTWVDATGTFTPNAPNPNAAMVTSRRSRENENMLPTNFLKIWGLSAWDVNTQAIALKYIPECMTNNGLVAGNRLDVTSNNEFSDICLHGENLRDDPGQNYAVDLGNGNTFNPGVQVSMPDLDDLNGRPNVCTNNTGLCDPGTLFEGSLPPANANADHLDSIVAGMTKEVMIDGLTVLVAGDDAPDYIDRDDPTKVHSGLDKDFKGPFLPGHIYIYSACTANNQVQLNDNTPVIEAVIIADCKIKSNSGAILRDAVIVSKSQGNGQDPLEQNSIDFASDTQIGDASFCDPDDGSGAVYIYSYASMNIAAGPDVIGLRMVALGNISFSANNSVAGISAEAAYNITATSNGNFEFCGGGPFDENFAYFHRLVR